MSKRTSKKTSPRKVTRASAPGTFKAGDRVKVVAGKMWRDEVGTVDDVDEGLVHVSLDVNVSAGQDAKAAVREFTAEQLAPE